jgi:hypothetical protein
LTSTAERRLAKQRFATSTLYVRLTRLSFSLRNIIVSSRTRFISEFLILSAQRFIYKLGVEGNISRCRVWGKREGKEKKGENVIEKERNGKEKERNGKEKERKRKKWERKERKRKENEKSGSKRVK